MSFFRKVNLSGKPEEVLQKCLETLAAEDARAEFDETFKEFARNMDMLMPDPSADPFLGDFKFAGAVREGARNLYRDESLSLSMCSRKVEDLIHTHIIARDIEEILKPINISAPDFKEKLAAKGSDKAKASHVEYAIKDTITQKIAVDPTFYGSLRERLEKLIEEYRQERINQAEYLKRLLELGDEEKRRLSFAKSIGLRDVKELAIFGLLMPFKECLFADSEEKQVAFTQEVIEIILRNRVIDWTDKDDIKQDMRREIRRKLMAVNCPADRIEPLIREIVGLAQVHYRDV